MRRVLATTAFAALALVAGACKKEPVPDRVAVVGDSLTFTASYYGGGLAPYDDAGKIGIGWQAEHAQPRVTQDVEGETTSMEVLVIALGQNDAARSSGRDGFTSEDRTQLQTLAETPHENACVSFVKPTYAPPAGQVIDQNQVSGIAAYRDWVDEMVSSNPERYRSVDWAPIVAEHPEYIDTDGIHLVLTDGPPPAAATAYIDVLRSAAAACEE